MYVCISASFGDHCFLGTLSTLPDLESSALLRLLSSFLVPKRPKLSYVATYLPTYLPTRSYNTRSLPSAAVAPSLCHGLRAAPLEDLAAVWFFLWFQTGGNPALCCYCAWMEQSDGLESTDDGRWVRRCGE